MKISHSPELKWDSSLSLLFKSKKPLKTILKLQECEIYSLYDLLWILPHKIEVIPKIEEFYKIKSGFFFTGIGKITNIKSSSSNKNFGKNKAPLKNITVTINDFLSARSLDLRWFNTYPSFSDNLKNESLIKFSGSVTQFNMGLQIINPELKAIASLDEAKQEHLASQQAFKITYPTINKISGAQIKKLFMRIDHALWDNIPENIPKPINTKRNLMPLSEAFKVLHHAINYSEENILRAKYRLAYQDFFSDQTKILARKAYLRNSKAVNIKIKKETLNSFFDFFPYELTIDQKKATHDILNDLDSGKPMMRMIQGDVGCGKTTIAIIAALSAIENGHQVALMAPTEVLALQHFRTINKILPHLKTSLLTGTISAKIKQKVYDDLSNGNISLVIGTHALIQENVKFKKLALAIIDEQHKFGVKQRLELVEKNNRCHCLIMTATPIPRSLSLTRYGDLDISTIKSQPAGRKKIQTRIINSQNYNKFLSFMSTRLSLNEQVYIVVPAIEDNDKFDLINLNKVIEKIRDFFPQSITKGLHGKMNSGEKENVLADFSSQQIDILIATSVVEVGIDNPNASIMAIMGPDRFGLSSLHQLRGRVGRGNNAGFCFLVNDRPISEKSSERLKIIEETLDGFIIAEKDLELRGHGDLFGKEQSGIDQKLQYANIVRDKKVLIAVREDIEELFKLQDPLIKKAISKASQEAILTITV